MAPNSQDGVEHARFLRYPILAGLAGLLLGLTSGIAPAQLNPRWDALNDPGNMGRVSQVAISPYDSKVILAAGDVLGVGLSTNGGATWEQTLGLTACSEINDFSFHPSDPLIVWAGTLSGPYQSTDGGKTWTLKRAGMPPLSRSTITAPIQKVLFDPNVPKTLLAVGGNHRQMGFGVKGTTCWGAVWRSVDGGETWTKLTTIDDSASGSTTNDTGVLINGAGFAAGSSSVVYACSLQGGVYKSIDGGQSFGKANGGLPNTEAWSVALHPTEAETLWVSLGRGGAIYQSTDGGRSWTNSSTGILTAGDATEWRTVAVAKSNPSYLYCSSWKRPVSAYRSTDGGATWTRIVNDASKRTVMGGTGNPSGFDFQWISVDPGNPSHVVGACEGNVVQSFDAGTTWKDITCFAVGDGWRGNGFSGMCGTAIAWNPYRPGQVFTLGMDGGKLERSDDSLWSWKLADPGLTGPFNGANDVTFAANGTIYVGSGQFGNTSAPYLNEPIIKSGNWGATWAYVSRPAEATGDNKAVYANPRDPNQVWAIMGNVLYQSRDGGDSWKPLSLEGSGRLWNLAADPGRPGTLYAGAKNGVFQTTDGDHFWLMPGSPTSSQFEYVFLDPVTPGRLYAVSFNSGSQGGVYRYEGSWKQIFRKPQARALAVDPGNPLRLAVLTKGWPAVDVNTGDGVWLSTNGGNDWTQCNRNLRMWHGTAIAFNPDKSAQLIVGMDGAGFYVTDLGSSTPYGGSALNVPGIIQAENYDLGGEGVAYHDTTRGNQGGDPYRGDDVDLRLSGSGHVVCDLAPGEWLKYQVHITAPGLYDVTFRAASPGGGAKFHLEANGVNVTGPVTIHRTGGADTWSDVVAHDVRFAAGTQYLKLCVEAAGADLDYIQATVAK